MILGTTTSTPGTPRGPDDPAEADLKKLQGVWTVESTVDRGETVPAGKLADLTVTFSGNKATLSAKPEDVVTVKLDPGRKPAAIDLALGKLVALGIYKFDGDTLTLCYTDFPACQPRPKGFVSTKENEAMLLVLKRKK